MQGKTKVWCVGSNTFFTNWLRLVADLFQKMVQIPFEIHENQVCILSVLLCSLQSRIPRKLASLFKIKIRLPNTFFLDVIEMMFTWTFVTSEILFEKTIDVYILLMDVTK